MGERGHFFSSLIYRVFSNWTALKLAVENDMGTTGEANQFCQYVANILTETENLCKSEIECILEDYMEDVFNTELQDFSSQQVAEELYTFYFNYKMGNVTQAESELIKLPPVQPWILPKLITQINKKLTTIEISSDSSESDEKEESMETEFSGWTVVKSGRKK